MLSRILILLVPALAEFGCTIGGRGRDAYEPFPKTVEGWRLHERDKRDILQVEDIKLGNSPLAPWGRKIRAYIEVRYTMERFPIVDPSLNMLASGRGERLYSRCRKRAC